MGIAEKVIIAISILYEIINLSKYLIYRKRVNKDERLMIFKPTNLPVFLFEKAFALGAGRRFLLGKDKRINDLNMKRRRLLLEIYEPSKVEDILKSAALAPGTYIRIFTPIIVSIGAISKEKVVILALVGLLILLCLYFDIWLNDKIKHRHREMQADFATLLTKMSLLVNAGLTAAESFELVAFSSEGLLYKEMQRSLDDIKNGMPYDEALQKLALRGGCKEVKKFVSLYRQNIEKGGHEFPYILSQMADVAWSEKKNRARLMGELASQKLLIPILLMFSGVILMIVIPAFNSFL